MRDHLTTVIEAVGLGMIVAGVGLIYEPLSYIVGGGFLAFLGYLASRT